MLCKTTNIQFQKYGFVYNEAFNKKNKYIYKEIAISSHLLTTMFYCDKEIRVESADFANIVVSKDLHQFDLFSIRLNLIIKPFQYFNIIPQNKKQTVKLIIPHDAKFIALNLMKPYIYRPIVPVLSIPQIVGCYYNIKKPDYYFRGEQHNFYELTYIDHGSLDCFVEDTWYTLHADDLMIYGPNQFHQQKVGDDQTCSYLTILFEMDINDDSKLLNTVFHLNDNLHNLLNKLSLTSDKQNIYSQTLMLCYLQETIIHLLQDNQLQKGAPKTPNIQEYRYDLFKQIAKYIDENINMPLSIEDITHNFSISRSSLQTLFKTNVNKTPKYYITDLKLNRSKKLLLENKYTVTEIAYMLGFSSIHYFSRAFKQRFNLTPSEYSKLVYHQQESLSQQNDEK